jgi:hypothetical protein
VADVRVVLHRVGQSLQGPIDSTRSDRLGRFHFGFRPDTSAFYLVSGRYAGIEYFSAPLPTNPTLPGTVVRVVVYDTSSSAPVALEARHLVLTRPGEEGSRSVLDLIILRNRGRLTRVAPDTLHGSWGVPLPRGTTGIQVRESDVSAEGLRRIGDSLSITAALAPGEKQVTLQYEVPAGQTEVALPVEAGLPLNVLTEEPSVTVAGAGLTPTDSQVIQGRSFRRWTGTVPAPGVIRLHIPGLPRTPGWLLAALVGGLAVGLLGTGWLAFSARGAPVQPVAPDALVDAIATLDARYLGRQDETPDTEWNRYETERARLKGALEASLAAGARSR